MLSILLLSVFATNQRLAKNLKFSMAISWCASSSKWQYRSTKCLSNHFIHNILLCLMLSGIVIIFLSSLYLKVDFFDTTKLLMLVLLGTLLVSLLLLAQFIMLCHGTDLVLAAKMLMRMASKLQLQNLQRADGKNRLLKAAIIELSKFKAHNQNLDWFGILECRF